MNKLLILMLGILFVFPIISASLVVTSPQNITVTKDYQVPKIIELNIKNPENFPIYNIKFEQSEIITIDLVNLSSGENKTISARIITNNPYEGNLTLRGEYEKTVGSSNITEEILINYNFGLDKCDLELTKGDSIKWINQVLDEVTLFNTDTNQDFKTILEGENYLRTFNDVTTLNYLVKRIGVPFTETCTIEVQPDVGLVHDSQYDKNIYAKIDINYDPTELSVEYIETNYTLAYNENADDVLKIKNNGSNIGKYIKLSADWITFNENNFDLSSGASKTIQYNIKPQVFETNETNKTHEITLTIEGNFPTITKKIYVFVPYAKLDSNFLQYDEQFIRNVILYACTENPDWAECQSQASYLNGTSSTIEITSESFFALLEKTAENSDNFKTYQQSDLEFKNNITVFLENQSARDDKQDKTLEELAKSQKTLSDSILLAVILLFSAVIIIVMILIWSKKGYKLKARNNLKMEKGEDFY